jgi:hypothetical protein
MMSISLSDRLITTPLTNGMLNNDPTLEESSIIGHIDNLTADFINRNLAFEGVLLFLATIILISLFADFMTLNTLFKGVDDDR